MRLPSPDRERNLSSWLHTVSPGTWMALFFLVRTATWATGCSSGPADGADGGKCIDHGCTQSCDPGLTCEGDICRREDNSGGSYNGNPGSGSSYYCGEISSPSCDSTQTAIECLGGATPNPAAFKCTRVAVDGTDETWCCDTRDAASSEEDSSASTGDAAATDAGDAGETDAADD